MGPRAGLDAVAKRKKIRAPARNRTPVVQSGAKSLYSATLIPLGIAQWNSAGLRAG
jgi:hypothetical protein